MFVILVSPSILMGLVFDIIMIYFSFLAFEFWCNEMHAQKPIAYCISNHSDC